MIAAQKALENCKPELGYIKLRHLATGCTASALRATQTHALLRADAEGCSSIP
jgi:hypothetical protein